MMPAEDKTLFERMAKEFTSDNERKFFEVLRERESLEISICDDMLLLEKENTDGLWLIRYYNHEYSFGAKNAFTKGEARRCGYVTSLIEALSAYLDESGLLPRHITLQEWLREQDYEPIHYDRLTEA